MILDKLTMFEPLAGTAVTVTAASTDVLDLSVARDLGVTDGPALEVNIHILEAFTASGSATLQIQVQGSTDNSTYYTMAESMAYAVADLTLGRRLLPIKLPMPADTQAAPRYLRLNYVVATGPMTAGKLFAGLNLDRQANRAYPAGINISN